LMISLVIFFVSCFNFIISEWPYIFYKHLLQFLIDFVVG
jgi:hypothetical protein